jgi:ribose transport system ATP-binding protein
MSAVAPGTERSSQDDRPVVLRVSNLSKTFPGTRALDDVSIDVRRGTIHALLGGNGSGKSTLIKILAGVYHGDPGGEIQVSGETVASDKTSPHWAKGEKIHFVHQNPGVFPELSVAENISIGRGFETGAGGRVQWRAVKKRTRALIDRYEIAGATPDTPVSRLRPADRTMVAIARALQDQEGEHEGVLVLDEPTTALPPTEVHGLLERLQRYAAEGQTIIYVTHRLDEIIQIADRCSVLRDGRHAGTVDVKGLTEQDLVELIVGRPLAQVFPDVPEPDAGDVVLDVRGLSGGPLKDVTFKLLRGEILGIAGLLGSGRSEILQSVFGAFKPASGQILLEDKPITSSRISGSMKAGIAYVPEERATQAAFLDMSVRNNLSAGQVSKYWRGLRLRHRAEAADARTAISAFFIKAHSDSQPINTLSGGNQQKCILSRWMQQSPKVLLLDEPTQGVDVGARAEIYSLVSKAVAEGTSAIVVTSDFDELARVCDRVIVLAAGTIVAELAHPNIEPHRLTELSFSQSESAARARTGSSTARKEPQS